MEQGLDSIKSAQLISQLSTFMKQELPITIFFKHPSPSLLSQHLSKLQFSPSPPIITNHHSNSQESKSNLISIVGASCRLPNQLNTPEKFFEFLKSSRRVIPTQNVNYISDEELYSFDSSFFKMSGREISCTDPQQRLLLTLTYEALQDANIPSRSIMGQNVCVFVGCSSRDYLLGDSIQIHSATGSGISMLANRISYHFDWTGKSMVIDTACSSSLVALSEAVDYLRENQNVEYAIVAGVNVCRLQSITDALRKANFLGDCKVFDKDADGYVRGEGAIV
ncbi:hypothetical protein AKO1_007156, partial [Acrasis kona]